MSRSAFAAREAFLRFFEQRGHARVAGSSLVPAAADETLMFTNSGMCQFKDRFLGQGSGPRRATSAQKCVRAGGKHNDLENVGFTPRHLTMFEMLGNFSFGDYFKEEAICLAWEFVTRELALPRERLRVTVFEGDAESAALWRKVGGAALPVHAKGRADNFWSMGDGAGVPCGPCTEIFWDRGASRGADEDARFLEIWNLVFMQHRVDGAGALQPLPAPSVDTGMGLERVASVLQGVESNFETDLLRPLVARADALLRAAAASPEQRLLVQQGFAQNVVADHVRSAAFLIADGVVPSNAGRGYVLRRLLRRAAGFAFRAGQREPFLHHLLPVLERSLAAPPAAIESGGGGGGGGGGAHPFPELGERRATVAAVVAGEEQGFFRTVEHGMRVLQESLEAGHGVSGDVCFKLYDTFGFPADLTAAICAQRGVALDLGGFEARMEQQRQRSAAAAACSWQFADTAGADGASPQAWAQAGLAPQSTCHARTREAAATVLAVLPAPPTEAAPRAAWLCISPCPFFAQGGGQAGDRGALLPLGASGAGVPVLDCVRPYKGGVAILVDMSAPGSDQLVPGATVVARVDLKHRLACSVHHTATHLLHAALRDVLGPQVMQAGSLVASDRLRFDFCHPEPLSKEQLARVETLVNAFAQANVPVQTREMALEEAKQADALMLFGEKYDTVVRVVSMSVEHAAETAEAGLRRSAELCGGTHVDTSAQVFPFKVTSEGSVAAGTRRVEAVAGAAALRWLEDQREALADVADVVRLNAALRGDARNVVEQAARLADKERVARQQAAALRLRLLEAQAAGPPAAARGRVAVHRVPDLCPDDAKETAEALKLFAARAVQERPALLHLLLCGETRIASAAGKDSGLDAGKALRLCLDEMGRRGVKGGKGGGGKEFAQGQLKHGDDALCVLDATTAVLGA